jgi:hypothetical protein
MTAYVALLRGVNVGGARGLPMIALRALFETAGALGVETLIQSGNVVFESREHSGADIVAAVGAAISREFGFDAPIVLRKSSTQLAFPPDLSRRGPRGWILAARRPTNSKCAGRRSISTSPTASPARNSPTPGSIRRSAWFARCGIGRQSRDWRNCWKRGRADDANCWRSC